MTGAGNTVTGESIGTVSCLRCDVTIDLGPEANSVVRLDAFMRQHDQRTCGSFRTDREAAVSGNDLSATAATPESAPVGPER